MQQDPQRVFLNRSRPYVTYVLIGINVAVFLVELVLQYVLGWPYGQTILTLGAKENLLITSGQYWRLLTACFLHANFMHIVSNLIGLYFWGPHAEVLFGRARYLLVYLASGLFGSLLSYAASEPLSVSVGASGAIFGIFGALLYFRTRHKQVFDQVFGMQVVVFIGLNLLNGFLSTGIDNLGHIGGLVGGFCASYVVGLYRERPTWKRVLACIGLVVLAAALFLIGFGRARGSPRPGPIYRAASHKPRRRKKTLRAARFSVASALGKGLARLQGLQIHGDERARFGRRGGRAAGQQQRQNQAKYEGTPCPLAVHVLSSLRTRFGRAGTSGAGPRRRTLASRPTAALHRCFQIAQRAHIILFMGTISVVHIIAEMQNKVN